MGNEVTKVLLEIAGKDKLEPGDACGIVDKPGTTEVSIRDDLGSVYGFAVYLEQSEVAGFFEHYNQQKSRINDVSQWKPIGNGYYPLYWGKAKEVVGRVNQHLNVQKQTGVIHLEDRTELKDKKVIYGFVQVKNSDGIEKRVREDYPDIYMTSSEKSENNKPNKQSKGKKGNK